MLQGSRSCCRLAGTSNVRSRPYANARRINAVHHGPVHYIPCFAHLVYDHLRWRADGFKLWIALALVLTAIVASTPYSSLIDGSNPYQAYIALCIAFDKRVRLPVP